IVSLIGVYVSKSIQFDIWFALIIGVIFFVLKRLHFSLPSFILAFVLGPIMEENLRRALLVSDGSYLIFLTRPFSIAILALMAILLVYLFVSNRAEKKHLVK